MVRMWLIMLIYICKMYFCDNREFTSLASQLVNRCHMRDKDLTQELLTTNVTQFGSQSPMITALNTENLKFTSQVACMECVSNVWKGDLCSRTPHWKVLSLIHSSKKYRIIFNLLTSYNKWSSYIVPLYCINVDNFSTKNKICRVFF